MQARAGVLLGDVDERLGSRDDSQLDQARGRGWPRCRRSRPDVDLAVALTGVVGVPGRVPADREVAARAEQDQHDDQRDQRGRELALAPLAPGRRVHVVVAAEALEEALVLALVGPLGAVGSRRVALVPRIGAVPAAAGPRAGPPAAGGRLGGLGELSAGVVLVGAARAAGTARVGRRAAVAGVLSPGGRPGRASGVEATGLVLVAAGAGEFVRGVITGSAAGRGGAEAGCRAGAGGAEAIGSAEAIGPGLRVPVSGGPVAAGRVVLPGRGGAGSGGRAGAGASRRPAPRVGGGGAVGAGQRQAGQ